MYVSFGAVGSEEEEAFMAITLWADTKLKGFEVGPDKPLDPASYNAPSIPSKYILIIAPALQLWELYDYVRIVFPDSFTVLFFNMLLNVLQCYSLRKLKDSVEVTDDPEEFVRVEKYWGKRKSATPPVRSSTSVVVDKQYGSNKRAKKEPEVIDVDAEPAPGEETARTRRRSSRRGAAPVADPADGVILFEYPMEENTKDVVTMIAGDAKRLEKGVYLNDSIIDFRIKYIMRQDHPQNVSKIHVFSCQFYSYLCREKDPTKAYKLVASWTKAFKLLEREFIFIIINKSEHWSIVVVVRPNLLLDTAAESTNKSCILFMDSLGLHGARAIYKTVIQ